MKSILQLAQQIAQLGGRLYLVGGAVRDRFLSIVAKDKDYVIEGLNENIIESHFINWHKVGHAFAVYKVKIDGEWIDIALARKESKQGKRHQDFLTIADQDITLYEDLNRRDFTVNAMAIDVLTDTLYDPYQGKEDLERGQLRAVSQAFLEDPLRVYRAARFAAVYGFSVEKQTMIWIEQLLPETNALPAERILQEWTKALATTRPFAFLDFIFRLQGEEAFFHSLKKTWWTKRMEPSWVLFVEGVCNKTDDLALRIAALMALWSYEEMVQFVTRIPLSSRMMDSIQLFLDPRFSPNADIFASYHQLATMLYLVERSKLEVSSYCWLHAIWDQALGRQTHQVWADIPTLYQEVKNKWKDKVINNPELLSKPKEIRDTMWNDELVARITAYV